MTYSVEMNSHVEWVCEVAAKRMLEEELGEGKLYDKSQAYSLASNGITFVCVKEGEPVGVLGAIETPHIFNPKFSVLAEVFWYVLPEYRNTRAGALIIKAFNEYAANNVDYSTMTLLPHSKVNGLEKLGYKEQERIYIKEYS